MNAFTAFLQADWAERAGWTLLHSLWQIAAVAAFYAIVAVLLGRRSANARYLLGCGAFLCMLGLPVGTYALLSRGAPLKVEEASTEPVVAALPAEPPVPLPEGPPNSLGDPIGLMFDSDEAVTGTVKVPAERPAATNLLSDIRHYMPWATAVWLAGVLLLSLRPLLGWWHVHRLRLRGLSPLPDALMEVGRRVSQRLHVNQAVEFVESALVEVPTVIGGLRPMVLLPASAVTGLSVAEIELILAHELAHVKRHDWLVNFAQTIIEALLFYHPAMWWVSSQIRKERENCCDDMAVSLGGSRSIYAQALTRLEEQRSPKPAAVLTATGGRLVTRVRRLLGQPADKCGYRYATPWIAGLVSIGFVVMVLAMNPPTGITRAEENKPPTSGIHVELIPGVFRDGWQWMRVEVSNDSTDKVTQLEPGGLPAEVLVDGARYRSTWVDETYPLETKPRIVQPGSSNSGRPGFTLNSNWMTVEGMEKLQLKPGRHVIRAVVYASDKNAPDGARKVRVLSNPIEIEADGRAAGFRNVSIRVLGGAEKKALGGLQLTATPTGGQQGVTATTQEDGTATFSLLPETYQIGLRSPKELPYLRIEAEQPHKGLFHRHITVAETPNDQRFDINLYDPSELVLRAVDEETGEGIAGVAFVTENVAGEMWAQTILNDTLGPGPRWSRLPKDHQSFQTDKDGYVRRFVGPRKLWDYYIWSTPAEYDVTIADHDGNRIVVPNQLRNGRRYCPGGFDWQGKEILTSVEIPTPLGQKKAEHTFLLRRRKAPKATSDSPAAVASPHVEASQQPPHVDFQWGRVVGGLAIRLRPENQTISNERETVEILIDVRNEGRETVRVGQGHVNFWLEVDRKWYLKPAITWEFIPIRELKPGDTVEVFLKVALQAGENKDWIGGYTQRDGKVPAPETNPDDFKPLMLAPSQHRVRIAIAPQPPNDERHPGPVKAICAYSNPVEIEVVAAEDIRAAKVDHAAVKAGISLSGDDVERAVGRISETFGLDVDRWYRMIEAERGLTPMDYRGQLVRPILQLRELQNRNPAVFKQLSADIKSRFPELRPLLPVD